MRLLTVCLVMPVLACVNPAPSVQDAPSGFVEPGELPGDWTVRHRIVYVAGDRRGSLEAVMQVHCGEVLVIGLAPFGVPLFSIRQHAAAVEANGPKRWPLPPEVILLDVHRIFLYPVKPPSSGDGLHARRVGDVGVVERWLEGRLLERSIEREGRAPVRIRFDGGIASQFDLRPVTLSDEEYGYQLEVSPLDSSQGICEVTLSAPGGSRARALRAVGARPFERLASAMIHQR
jgi:hypothetical protein